MEVLLKIGYKFLVVEIDFWYLIGVFFNKLLVFFLMFVGFFFFIK